MVKLKENKEMTSPTVKILPYECIKTFLHDFKCMAFSTKNYTKMNVNSYYENKPLWINKAEELNKSMGL